MKLSSLTWAVHVAAQGGHKDVKNYTDNLKPGKELGRDDLLRDFKRTGNTK
ncbi:MAG: hypothetical protein GXP46_01965 [Deferribacteres bacterium]|nr:hypothetical protein [Deferribacteres bacterium]